VIRDHLLALVDEQPPDLVSGPVRRRVVDTLDAEHDEGLRHAVDELTSDRYFRLLDALDSLVAGEALDGRRSQRSARKGVGRAVGRAYRRMDRLLDTALRNDPPVDEDLHEVRKAAKRARYAAESAGPVFGDKADSLAKRMEQIQETLGEHQDSVVVRELLQRLAGDAAAAEESTFTYGRLHALEEARAERSRAAFLADVEKGITKRPSWLR
jgi:CHAD domain-containing protein